MIQIFIVFVISRFFGKETSGFSQYPTWSSEILISVSGSLRVTWSFGLWADDSSSGASILSILSSILILLWTCEALLDL